ncbi:MAG: hypothetical protein FWC26_03635 [Fibromonadales bacterium]|nr:hypothetical protein [Fibromonadales bacterium]
MNYIVATYLIRLVGVLLIIPSLMPITFSRWFPGLIAESTRWVPFIAGVAIYIGASIAYHIFRQRERRKANERERD